MQHAQATKVDSVAMRALATMTVDDCAEGDEVECSWCARTVEMIPSTLVSTAERTELIEHTIALFEHCCFDHGGRADVIKVSRCILTTWAES